MLPYHFSIGYILKPNHDVRAGQFIDQRLEAFDWPPFRPVNAVDSLHFSPVCQAVFGSNDSIWSNDDDAITFGVDLTSGLNAVANPDGFSRDRINTIEVTLLLINDSI